MPGKAGCCGRPRKLYEQPSTISEHQQTQRKKGQPAKNVADQESNEPISTVCTTDSPSESSPEGTMATENMTHAPEPQCSTEVKHNLLMKCDIFKDTIIGKSVEYCQHQICL